MPPSARASPLPQGFRDWREILLQRLPTVGAGLLAKAICQLSSLVTVPPSSRASPLPQGFRGWREILLQHLPTVGAGLLAKAMSVVIVGDCTADLAGKPAPTGVSGLA
ncbi:hypothetical protein CXF97_00975 [Pseudomonas sp. Choline-02u-1]|nr:hypothetical protein CXF97_00975 [Pseudomonas sp. Choline-02u-1]